MQMTDDPSPLLRAPSRGFRDKPRWNYNAFDRPVRHFFNKYQRRALPALQDPAEVWLSKHALKGREVERYKFLTAWEGDEGKVDGALVVAQKDAREGLLFWTFYRVNGNQAINNRRAGTLVYQRGRK